MKRKALNVALVGYGRMGHEVEEILLERGHTVGAHIDPALGTENQVLSSVHLKGIDGVIEFSLPDAVEKNVNMYAKAGLCAVIGTTGWEAQREIVRKTVEASGIGLVYGSNYSVGAHLFFRIVAQAAKLLENADDYDIMVHEYHHKGKADSPSGTALSTAAVILENLSRKTSIQTQALDRAIRPEELHVSSTRGGNIPGIHTVRLDGTADSIEITHNARSRKGFALGSVLALEWLYGKKGFFEVKDFINSVFI